MYLTARRVLSRGELCALLMWGTWSAVTGGVFSFMGGMVHPYYTVALAPAIAALVGIGAVWAWRRRSSWDGRCALAVMILLAAASSAVLLHRTAFEPAWLPWLIVALAVGERRRRTAAASTDCCAGGRMLGRTGRDRGVFRRNRGDPAITGRCPLQSGRRM